MITSTDSCASRSSSSVTKYSKAATPNEISATYSAGCGNNAVADEAPAIPDGCNASNVGEGVCQRYAWHRKGSLCMYLVGFIVLYALSTKKASDIEVSELAKRDNFQGEPTAKRSFLAQFINITRLGIRHCRIMLAPHLF